MGEPREGRARRPLTSSLALNSSSRTPTPRKYGSLQNVVIEAVQAMVIQYAKLFLYPTAIRSEPQDEALDYAMKGLSWSLFLLWTGLEKRSKQNMVIADNKLWQFLQDEDSDQKL